MNTITFNPTQPLRLEERWLDDRTAVIAAFGELCFESAHSARAAFARMDARIPVSMTVDLRGVTLLDSSGLSVLVDAREASRRSGGAFRVVASPGTHPRHVLDITLLSASLHVCESIDGDDDRTRNLQSHSRRQRDEDQR